MTTIISLLRYLPCMHNYQFQLWLAGKCPGNKQWTLTIRSGWYTRELNFKKEPSGLASSSLWPTSYTVGTDNIIFFKAQEYTTLWLKVSQAVLHSFNHQKWKTIIRSNHTSKTVMNTSHFIQKFKLKMCIGITITRHVYYASQSVFILPITLNPTE